MRSVIYVLGGAPATDERNFKRLRASRAELEPSSTLSEFKRLVRDQFFILKLDRERALSSLPELLKGQSSSDIDGHIEHLEHVFAASGELSEHAAERFEQVKTLFDQARPPKAAQPKATQPKATQPKAVSVPATDTKQAGDQKAAIDTQTAASSPTDSVVTEAESVLTEKVSAEKDATQRASTETVPATNNVATDAAKEASKPQPRAASRRKPPRKR